MDNGLVGFSPLLEQLKGCGLSVCTLVPYTNLLSYRITIIGFDSRRHLEKAHNSYKKRYRVGVQDVVGTPYAARTTLFQKFPFNERMLNSDDTEFCLRLRQAQKSIYRSTVVCYETGFNGLLDIVERWMRWGRGDSLFHHEMKQQWTLSRKIRSWLHPFKAEILTPKEALTSLEYLYIFPFLIITLNLRYLGRLKYWAFKK